MTRLFVSLILFCIAACAPSTGAATRNQAPTIPSLASAAATVSSNAAGAATPAPPRQAEPTPLASSNAPTDTASASLYEAALLPPFHNDLAQLTDLTIYQMDMQLNSDLTKLDGKQQVNFTNRTNSTLNEIYFRLFANFPGSDGAISVSSVAIDSKPVQPSSEAQDTALRVPLGMPLAPGSKVALNLDFQVTIPFSSSTRYSDFTRKDWITTLPTVYPLIPDYDEKGWHIEVPPEYGDLVYSDSSVYDVRVTAPSKYTVIASGETVDKQVNGDQTLWHIIAAPVRDFDMILSDTLVNTSKQAGDVTINSWYQPVHAQGGKDALKWVADAVNIFQKRIGAYPFKTLDVVETPTTAGGIEYPGLITLATSLYEHQEELSYFEVAAVHETAHQWWYSLVGNDQVNHPWLDEALTQYMVLVYMEDRYGEGEGITFRNQFMTSLYDGAKAQFGDMPGGLPVSGYSEVEYGAFVYAKAPLFFDAVRRQIGDDAFFQALQKYFQTYEYKIATPQDLVNIFNTVSGQDVTPLYQKWIDGT